MRNIAVALFLSISCISFGSGPIVDFTGQDSDLPTVNIKTSRIINDTIRHQFRLVPSEIKLDASGAKIQTIFEFKDANGNGQLLDASGVYAASFYVQNQSIRSFEISFCWLRDGKEYWSPIQNINTNKTKGYCESSLKIMTPEGVKNFSPTDIAKIKVTASTTTEEGFYLDELKLSYIPQGKKESPQDWKKGVQDAEEDIQDKKVEEYNAARGIKSKKSHQ